EREQVAREGRRALERDRLPAVLLARALGRRVRDRFLRRGHLAHHLVGELEAGLVPARERPARIVPFELREEISAILAERAVEPHAARAVAVRELDAERRGAGLQR